MSTVETSQRLEAQRVTLGYKYAPVSTELDVSIPDQSFTVIVGPNGCGKSTLLKGLSRLIKPLAGDVILDGKHISSYPSKSIAKVLGLLPQSADAPIGAKVKEVIARGRYPHQTLLSQWSSQDIEAIDAAIAATQLEPFLERQVEELSGGQRQRVWVAMVLAQQTPYLLLDEPTTYLDIAHQIELMDLFRELHRKEGRTIVAVLHDLNQACRYASHIIAMKSGAIIASGTPSEVITEARVKEVFGLDCLVIEDPVSGTPLVIPKDKNA